jgi:hypothetical protein
MAGGNKRYSGFILGEKMKKNIFKFIFLITGMCVYAQNGIIKEMTGTVELKSPGASGYVPAKAGEKVSQQTVISTGFKSTALIEVGGAVLTVRPLTRLTLTEISASMNSETLNLNLQTGRVRVEVNPPAGGKAVMSVKSPIATASVRGTSFDFDTRNIYVNRGKVSFHGRRGAGVLVNAGFASGINDTGKAANPIETHNRNLLPPFPVGYETGGGALSLTITGNIIITMEY